MRKIVILFLIVFCLSCAFIGCDKAITSVATNNESSDMTIYNTEGNQLENLKQDIVASVENIDKLYVGMTYEETMSIMGVRDRSLSSALHPFRYEWDLDDGSVLCMTFAIENYEEIIDNWHSNDSGPLLTGNSIEIPKGTEEQLEYMRELLLKSKCISAYIKKGKDVTTIE